MKRIFLILFFNFILIACMNSTTYEYADGSANVYIIKSDSLEYVPVRLEQSSTGFYSGGEPKKVSIKIQDFRNLRAMLEVTKSKHTIHIPDRIKGSGVITTFSGTEKKRFILEPKCKEMNSIETELKRLLQ